MSLIKTMLGGEIKEIDAGLHAVDKALTDAETKILPFVEKFGPALPKILAEVALVAPSLSEAVTPAEIAEFSAALTALPSLITALHAGLAAAENKVEHL